MKYKPRANSSFNSVSIKNAITTYHLKIKNINILLDDITTDKTTQNTTNIKRSNSLQNSNDLIKKISDNRTKNFNNYIYNKKKFYSKKEHEDNNKTLKSIPISFKKTESYINTESTLPTFLTTKEGFYTTNLTGLISERNCFNKNMFENKNNYNDIRLNIDELIEKRKIYIKKSTKNNSKFNYRRSYNHKDIEKLSLTKPLIKVKGMNKYIYKSQTINLKNLKENSMINTNCEKKIENKKIKLNKKNRNNHFNKKESLLETKKEITSIYNIKYIIIIQRWWKNKKYKKSVILIQKHIRSFLKKKQFNNNKATITSIPKSKNISQICYINKIYYKNNNLSILLIQKHFKKHLTKINYYNLFSLSTNDSYVFWNNKKPKIKPCYISKGKYKKGILNLKSIDFINNKINNTISKKKRSMKYKLLINNYNSYSYNFKTKDYNLKVEENINFESLNNSESHDYNNNDIINKIKNEYLEKKNINDKETKTILHDFFIKNIFYKIYLSLFQAGTNYKNIFVFINSIYYIFIKFKFHKFFQNLSALNTKKLNFIKCIQRHIKIYKKSNIKNEIIELIDKNFPKEDVFNLFDSKIIKFNSIQENNLINTQIFQEDNNLINYIYLFFKYEKDKIININFIKNRLLKEPLNYRNIFTILRYIDNLNEKINSNKICTKCFCKKNEIVCSLKCNCHFSMNIKINNNNNLIKNYERKKEMTYQIGEENIENNPFIANIDSGNKSFIKFNQYNDVNLDLSDTFVRGIRIHKTFHYFNE